MRNTRAKNRSEMRFGQRRSPLGWPGGRGSRYFRTVRCEICIPSFRRNSLSIRSSPHAANQILYLRWHTWSVGLSHQDPEQPPTRAVPADKRIWAHHHQSIAPLEESREQRESDAGGRIDTPRILAAFDLLSELPAQHQDLRAQGALPPDGERYKPGQIP